MFRLALGLFLGAILHLKCLVVAEVVVISTTSVLYDKTSPKLRIKTSGIDTSEDDVVIVLGATGQKPLVADVDYTLTTTDSNDGLILKLLPDKRWADVTDRTPPVALILSSVKFGEGPELLAEKAVVANVLSTPGVVENLNLVLYSTVSNELRVNMTGIAGAKDVDLFFDPPIFKGVGYELVSKFPSTKNEVVLRIRTGYSWRDTPGNLYVKGIDTGAGMVKVGGETGVQVAVVSDNLPAHSVTVDVTSDDQFIYHDEGYVTVTGSGFNPDDTSLRFSNGILGRGVNYTVIHIKESQLTLSLVKGSLWRANVENLPGFLNILAVNAGEGFVAVGPINSQIGRDVATVFERPTVNPGTTKLYRTHSHELHIYGGGFTTQISRPKIRFSPALVEGVDYTIRVEARDDLEITLLDSKSWGAVGPLKVEAFNARGDDMGWVVFPKGGVKVADIAEDVDPATTGGVAVFFMGTKIYQSVLQRTLDIVGSGFKSGMDITFDPPLVKGTDFDLSVVSENQLTLTLRPGKVWSALEGLLFAKTVVVGGTSYKLAGGDGIRVAVVYLDPVVDSGSDKFHESQSKIITLSGKGFSTSAEMSVLLKPTDAKNYKIFRSFGDTLRLQLNPGLDWLPAYLTLKPEDEKVPLEVLGIDTGAGMVKYGTPVVVGYIIADRPGIVCDDSCEYALNGVCDDGSENKYEDYYEEYGYGDDWQTNEYMDDEEGGGEGKGKGKGGGKGGKGSDYGAYEDDYYMENDEYTVSACVKGTDCTDCGGPDAIIDEAEHTGESCTNTCVYARDNICDDPRGENYCALGTDCQDCGPVGMSNFTRIEDDEWWEDDDDYFDDDSQQSDFGMQNKGLDANRDKVRSISRKTEVSTGGAFLTVLEGTVYTIGALFAAGAVYLGVRWYNGSPLPFVDTFDSSAVHDLEGTPLMRMEITPDVIRT